MYQYKHIQPEENNDIYACMLCTYTERRIYFDHLYMYNYIVDHSICICIVYYVYICILYISRDRTARLRCSLSIAL